MPSPAIAQGPTGSSVAGGKTQKDVTRDAHHPGNVFLSGQDVVIPRSADVSASSVTWRLLDDRLAVIKTGTVGKTEGNGASRISLGKLDIGWYRMEFLDSQQKPVGSTTAAVLARLRLPVSHDSPICVDGALSWYPIQNPEDRRDLAQLASVAGLSWIRDRLKWRELQTGPDVFAGATEYDAMADVQTNCGLKVLQTFHGTPAWACEAGGGGRFPPDLRHVYRFGKAMATRFKGRVHAWEPWNEGNAASFGGHTIDQMCTYQKAAYLGFKAGDPNITVCWNPIGGINTPSLVKGIIENETWPYHEVYSIHSYDWPDGYERLWAPARSAACGRPIWVTECDRGMKAIVGSPMGDLSHEDAIRKAEFMAHSCISSLYAGASRHFHFILPHYMEQENTIQFGLLRRDLTPRPSYVALAAVARFLAEGKCLGRWRLPNQPNAHVYAFKARPDGVDRDVLVAWVEEPADWPQRGRAHIDWPLPKTLAVEGVFDYLGRSMGQAVPGQLRSSAVFVVLSAGQACKLPLAVVPASEYRSGQPSPIVLQLEMPRSATLMRKEAWTEEHERTRASGDETELTIVVYNFDSQPAEGVVAVERAPSGCRLTPDRWPVRIEPMDRQELRTCLAGPASAAGAAEEGWFRLRGDFGGAGQPVLAFRLIQRTQKP